jgi:SAM-dependent methyltransferase
VFTESADLYDAIYFTFKDYAEEADAIARQLRAAHPSVRTVLDVGCGTGEHARLLATHHGLAVDGLDLNAAFVRLAQQKHPAGHFYVADMVAFNLARRYDAVICMFSSIGYVRTTARLTQTLASFRRHLAPGGVVLIEPWFPPGVLEPGHHSSRSAAAGAVRVQREATTEVEGRISRLRFEYEITEAGAVRHASETHELGLFSEGEMLAAFTAAGLNATHEAPSSRNRGLYIARV